MAGRLRLFSISEARFAGKRKAGSKMPKLKESVSSASTRQVSAVSPYLTTDEAVAYTRTSGKTLRRAELAGELPSFKPGKTKLYRATDLERWVATKATQITPCGKIVRPKLSELLGATR
jgi:excisionase family DNA binding protein